MVYDTPYQLLAQIKKSYQAQSAQVQLKAQQSWRGLSFLIGQQVFVTPIEHVAQVIPLADIHGLPGAQAWVRGVIQVRGELIIINDLHAFLFDKETKMDDKVRILIIKHQQEKVGFLLSKVLSISSVDEQHELDDTNQSDKLYLSKVWVKDTLKIPVIDLQLLMKHPSFLQATKRVS
jgi:chemotaxis signal transduction protein